MAVEYKNLNVSEEGGHSTGCADKWICTCQDVKIYLYFPDRNH